MPSAPRDQHKSPYSSSTQTWRAPLLGIAFFVLLYIGYWAIYALSHDAHMFWFGGSATSSSEDRAFEWLGFAGFVGAGILSVLIYRQRGKVPAWIMLYFLGIGLFYLVCAGEEISWGQRVFGWETPEGIAAINEQGETNLHNLENLPVHPKDIVSWFMKLFGIGLPIAFFLAFRKRDHLLRHCVAPLSLAPLFIFVEVFNKLEEPIRARVEALFDNNAGLLVRTQHEEIMEMYWGLCVLFAAVSLYRYWRKHAATVPGSDC